MRLSHLAVVIMLIIMLSACANAFDGHKRGFMFGGGLGYGMTSFTQRVQIRNSGDLNQTMTSDRFNKGVLFTDVRIGWGIDDQTEICFFNKSSWFNMANGNGVVVTIDNEINGVAVTHSLKSTSPTWFFTGGLAISGWSLPFENYAPNTWIGLGFYGGVGYEFARHYGAEFNVMYTNPRRTENDLAVSAKTVVFALTINAMAF